MNVLLSVRREDSKLAHLHHSLITGTGLSSLQSALSWISETVMIQYEKKTIFWADAKDCQGLLLDMIQSS